MANHELLDIDIKNLYLDVQNPRHDVLSNQIEALREIIIDQRGKLLNLAQDIASQGINPSELTIVIPAGDDMKDDYIVLEGNRRLAAIKLMKEPDQASLGYSFRDVEKFKRYSQEPNANQIVTLTCVVFTEREEAAHWIELKHTGENEGRGVVRWGAKETARFNDSLGKPSRELQIIEFVQMNAELTEAEKAALKKPNISSIKRLINDPDVRAALGIEFSGNDVRTTFAPEEVIKNLTKLVTDVASRKITVNRIRSKDDRAEYMEDFSEDDLPGSDTEPISAWILQSQKETITPSHSRLGGSTKSKVRRSVPISTFRKRLIPANCTLVIPNRDYPRINRIYRELRDIDIDEFPNACAVLFRLLLEFSLIHYNEVHQMGIHSDTRFQEKVRRIAKHMEENETLSTNDLKPLRVACSTKDSLFSIDTLHAYVHNPSFLPKANDLKETWDGVKKFFEAIWP